MCKNKKEGESSMSIRSQMARVVYGLCCFVTIAYAQTPVIISIGESCTGATILRTLGLRHEAYPFDWVISEFDPLYAVFADDFQYFFDHRYLQMVPDGSAVIDYYGISFRHDLPTTNYNYERDDGNLPNEGTLCENWRDYVPNAYAKYRRRIERLHKVLSSTNKVYLLRYAGIDKKSAIKLRNVIHEQYPKLDFTLVMVAHDREFCSDWNKKRIKNFYFSRPAEWQDLNQWRPIFKTLGLL